MSEDQEETSEDSDENFRDLKTDNSLNFPSDFSLLPSANPSFSDSSFHDSFGKESSGLSECHSKEGVEASISSEMGDFSENLDVATLQEEFHSLVMVDELVAELKEVEESLPRTISDESSLDVVADSPDSSLDTVLDQWGIVAFDSRSDTERIDTPTSGDSHIDSETRIQASSSDQLVVQELDASSVQDQGIQTLELLSIDTERDVSANEQASVPQASQSDLDTSSKSSGDLIAEKELTLLELHRLEEEFRQTQNHESSVESIDPQLVTDTSPELESDQEVQLDGENEGEVAQLASGLVAHDSSSTHSVVESDLSEDTSHDSVLAPQHTLEEVIQNNGENDGAVSQIDIEESEITTDSSLLSEVEFEGFSTEDLSVSLLDASLSLTELSLSDMVEIDTDYFPDTASDSINQVDTIEILTSDFTTLSEDTVLEETLSSSPSLIETEIYSLEDDLEEAPSVSVVSREELSISEVNDLQSFVAQHPVDRYTKHLHLLSHGSTLPKAPPYDFFADLTAQEEATLFQSLFSSGIVRSFDFSKLIQEIRNYFFAFQQRNRLSSKMHQQFTKDSSISKIEDNKSLKEISSSELTVPTLDFSPDPTGIFYHLSVHVPALIKSGTATLIDAILDATNTKEAIATELINENWGGITSIIIDSADDVGIPIDKRIIRKINDLVRTKCRISMIIDRNNVSGHISSGHLEYDTRINYFTEVEFSTLDPVKRKLKSIKTYRNNFLFNPKLQSERIEISQFKNFNNWREAVFNESQSIEITTLYPWTVIPTLKSEFNFSRLFPYYLASPKSIEENFFVWGNKSMMGGDPVHGIQYLSTNSNSILKEKDDKLIVGDQIFSKATFLFQITDTYAQMTGTQIKPYLGKTSVHTNERILNKFRFYLENEEKNVKTEKPLEKTIELLLGEDGIFTSILAISGNIQENDLFIVRNQVSTRFSRVPINLDLDPAKFGDPSGSDTFRKPDYVIITGRVIEGDLKIHVHVIEIKREWEDFNHDSNGRPPGYGLIQPIRDLPWVLKPTLDTFPEVSLKDIKVSCYNLTAIRLKGKEDIFKIRGEITIKSIPASIVIPFAGRNAGSNKQAYAQIRAINEAYSRSKTQSQNEGGK